MDTAQHSRVIEADWLAASPIGPCGDPRHGGAAQPGHQARLAAHAQAYERHAPAAVGRAVQRVRTFL